MGNSNSAFPGFSARMLAHNIDLVILLPFFYLIGSYIEDNWTLFGLCFGLYVLYHSVFELTKWRATPGKKMQRMCVEGTQGGLLRADLIFLRNTAKLISALPLFVGFAMISLDPKRRALHDRIAGAIVRFCP